MTEWYNLHHIVFDFKSIQSIDKAFVAFFVVEVFLNYPVHFRPYRYRIRNDGRQDRRNIRIRYMLICCSHKHHTEDDLDDMYMIRL